MAGEGCRYEERERVKLLSSKAETVCNTMHAFAPFSHTMSVCVRACVLPLSVASILPSFFPPHYQLSIIPPV